MEQLHKFLNRLSIVALVLLVVGLGIAGSFAFKSENLSNIEKQPTVITDESGNTGTYYWAGSNQQKIFALDTLTTAGTTTITVPWNMASPYQYQYFFKMRKIGVTPNVKVVLDERNAANSALWSAIDSVSMVGAESTKLNFRLRGSVTYGSFHRLRFVKVGNGGVARNTELVIKPTN